MKLVHEWNIKSLLYEIIEFRGVLYGVGPELGFGMIGNDTVTIEPPYKNNIHPFYLMFEFNDELYAISDFVVVIVSPKDNGYKKIYGSDNIFARTHFATIVGDELVLYRHHESIIVVNKEGNYRALSGSIDLLDMINYKNMLFAIEYNSIINIDVKSGEITTLIEFDYDIRCDRMIVFNNLIWCSVNYQHMYIIDNKQLMKDISFSMYASRILCLQVHDETLISVHAYNEILIWNKNGDIIRNIEHVSNVHAICSYQGKIIMADADMNIGIWDEYYPHQDLPKSQKKKLKRWNVMWKSANIQKDLAFTFCRELLL